MIEVDIPRSLFEEQGRQLYGGQLLQLQVCVTSPIFSSLKPPVSSHLLFQKHILIKAYYTEAGEGKTK